MKDKEYSGNFYEADKVEELPDECPNCLYQKKRYPKRGRGVPQLPL
ncbi:MAG: hypothetical protein ACLSEY_18270 [Enterocloster sp.]